MMDHCPLCRKPIEERIQKTKNNRSFDNVKSPSNSSISAFVRVNSQRKSTRATSAVATHPTDTVRSIISSTGAVHRKFN